MTDALRQGLAGPVRRVVTTRNPNNGSETFEAHLFDRSGKLILWSGLNPDGTRFEVAYRYDSSGDRVSPELQVIRDGVGERRLEVYDVSHLDAWYMEGLHQCGFGTEGAKSVRTLFSDKGSPIKTVFDSDEHEPLFEILYKCDEHGRILEALRYDQRFEGVSYEGELSRTSFRYDDVGRVIRRESSLAGQRTAVTTWSYNQYGDPVTQVVNSSQIWRFEYEYDQAGNWTRKLIHHPTSSSDEECRTIEYYPSEAG